MDRLAAFIVGEGNWLPLAMSVAFVAAGWLHYSLRRSAITQRQRILAVMNLFTGVMLLVMGIGHVLAVTTKVLTDTLARNSPPVLYAIGLAILIPATLVIRHTRKIVNAGEMRS